MARDIEQYVQEGMCYIEDLLSNGTHAESLTLGLGYTLRVLARIRNGQLQIFEHDFECFPQLNGKSIERHQLEAVATRSSHLFAKKLRQNLVNGFHGDTGVKVECFNGKLSISPYGKTQNRSRFDLRGANDAVR